MSESFDTADSSTPIVPEGAVVFDVNDDKVGTVDRVLRSPTGEPAHLSVSTGILRSGAIVPLDVANITESGIRIPYTKDVIRSAPQAPYGYGESLTPEEEERVHDHFNLGHSADVPVGSPAPDHERLDASTSGVAGAPDSGADDVDASHSPARSDDQGITEVTPPDAGEKADHSKLDSGTGSSAEDEFTTREVVDAAADEAGSSGSTAAGQNAVDGGPDIRI